MRQIGSVLTFSLLLVLLVAGVLSNFVLANPLIHTKPIYAKVSIEYPQNDLYNGSNVQLSFTILTNRFVQSYF